MWCYHNEKRSKLKRAIPLYAINVSELKDYDGKFHIELKETGPDPRKYLLAATSAEVKSQWIQALRRETRSPPVNPAYPFSFSNEREANHMSRFGFVRAERDFIRSLTNICEELEYVNSTHRKTLLREKLSQLPVPGCVYIPIFSSTDSWTRVTSVVSDSAIPISLTGPCSCLIPLETQYEGESTMDVSSYLNLALKCVSSNIVERNEHEGIAETNPKEEE